MPWSRRERESEAAGGLGQLEARFEEDRRLLDERDAAWRALRDELHAADREMDRLDRDGALARQQAADADAGMVSAREQAAALASRLEVMQRENEAQRSGRVQVESQVSAADGERARLEEARRAIEERIAALEGDLAGGRAAFLHVVDALSDARNGRRQIEEARQKQGLQGGVLDREQALNSDSVEKSP